MKTSKKLDTSMLQTLILLLLYSAWCGNKEQFDKDLPLHGMLANVPSPPSHLTAVATQESSRTTARTLSRNLNLGRLDPRRRTATVPPSPSTQT